MKMIPENQLAQSIIQIFKQRGIEHIVISPGSRNAPLTLGIASDEYFKCYSIIDERSAGFFALGMAQQMRKAVVLLCTSGSALLNYYPAFAEAYYSQIPLIVVSADRPANKIDIGDGQTIRQKNVYANHSAFNANLTETASISNDNKIHKAIDICIEKQLPVHINCPFEEPLYNFVEKYTYTVKNKRKKDKMPPAVDLDCFVKQWGKTAKKMVVIGTQYANVLSKKSIDNLINDPNTVVLSEAQSNVRHNKIIQNIDLLITNFKREEFEKLQPELLISIGGMVVSKRIKSFLREYQPAQHWHIDPLRAYDTYQVGVEHIPCPANDFFENIEQSSTNSGYRNWALEKMEKNKKKSEKFLKKVPFSDLKAFEIIFKNLPSNTSVHISNSSSIRYAQLYNIPHNTEIFCNRGTSGIDGCTSTAVGFATHNQKNTILITGDVSFLYDSNAFLNNYVNDNLKIIIINNGGGGIFRILPGHQNTLLFNQYLETQHSHSAYHLARMHKFDYMVAVNSDELKNNIIDFFNKNKPTILEIFTPTEYNEDILKKFFASTK